MTTTNDKLVEVLNDLIQINNDRVNGYERAAEETKDKDVDLQAIFTKMADDSRGYAAELTQEVRRLGGTPDTGTTYSGKLYRVWMDVKAVFSGKDRQAILENCEFGEDAAQKAYREALASDAEIDAETRQLITDQQSELKTAHDLIKKYRDAHKAVND
jgi:uncharacterized protein (TIGR02284 family)